MKNIRGRRRMGMAVLAGGLAFVGSAEATELLLDGSFENTTPSSNPVVKVGGTANPGVGEGWSTFSTYLYSTQYTLPGPPGSGLAFLRPYPSGTYGITQSSTNAIQSVSLTSGTTLTPAKIDAGSGNYTMSAWFSSYLTQGDYSDLTLEFLNDADAVVGTAVSLGGSDFIINIPTGANSKFPDAKEWARDSRNGTIPAGARKARVTIQATSVSGAPDGYVDLVSLDVVDAALTVPALTAADPANNAVGVGPLVNLSVTLQDRSTAVATNTIKLFLDKALVSPLIQKVETNTTVTYAAGVLPALSAHDYSIIFGDMGTPSTLQTNSFHFTVADYLTLLSALSSPLGSENASKPGFNVTVYQVETLPVTDPPTTQVNIPQSIAFAESVLAGLVGPNVADLSNNGGTNTFAAPGVINWIDSTGATANFPGDEQFPGIPGTLGSEDSFVDEILTYVRFPAAGYYQMGVNSEDHFRLTLATSGVQTLRVVSPTNMVIPCVPIATNITRLQFGGSLPTAALTAPVVYATPSGNPDDACYLRTNTSLAGKIALMDRGGTACDSAAKAEQAHLAGAVAVIETTPGDTGFPFRLDDINTNVPIPVLVIGENYGGGILKSSLTNGIAVTIAIQGDPTPRLAEWDGPKQFGAVDVTFGFAAPNAGLYPMRLVAGHQSGRADLEWFSVKPDGTKILINDTSNPDALLAFRARTFVEQPKFNPVTLSGGNITLSWTGSGTLQETTSFSSWTDSPNQSNPQTVPATGSMKYYRIKQ